MSIHDKRYYEFEEPLFRKAEACTEAKTATLEATPATKDAATIVEFSAIALMEPGRDRSVEGHLDLETARELHTELGELLDKQ